MDRIRGPTCLNTDVGDRFPKVHLFFYETTYLVSRPLLVLYLLGLGGEPYAFAYESTSMRDGVAYPDREGRRSPEDDGWHTRPLRSPVCRPVPLHEGGGVGVRSGHRKTSFLGRRWGDGEEHTPNHTPSVSPLKLKGYSDIQTRHPRHERVCVSTH